MKNIILLLLLISSISYNLFGQSRNVVFMRGAGATSNSWLGMMQEMENEGYNYDYLLNSDFENAMGAGVAAAANEADVQIGDNTNVLGIAHDYGGLILRQTQLQQPNISAMIFNGVPHKGSAVIKLGRPNAVGSPSELRKLANLIQNAQGSYNCNDCGLVSAFGEFVDGIANSTPAIEEMFPNSPVIQGLEANPPTVPFVVIWGAMEPRVSISRLMSSSAIPSGTDVLSDCYNDIIAREIAQAENELLVESLQNVGGFLQNVFNFIGSLISSGNSSGGIISATGDFIGGLANSIAANINTIFNYNQELARIARCKYAKDLLEIEYTLMTLANSQGLVEQEIMIDDPECVASGGDYDDCIQECETDVAWGDVDPSFESCEEQCAGLGDCQQIAVTIMVVEPSDGILSQSEQFLAGGEVTPYKLSETDHFLETNRFHAPSKQVLEDIFQGDAGTAFIIPQ